MRRTIVWESYHIEENLEDFVDEESFKEFDEDMGLLGQPVQLFNTPFGLVNIDQKLNPFNEYKLWKMYTTFTIDEDVQEIVQRIHGVEVFVPVSRYLCIIGVGKLFDSPSVRLKIMEKLEVDAEEPNDIEELISVLSEYNYWGILVIPNGEVDYFHTDDTEEFGVKIANYEAASDLSGGTYYSSERD